MKSVAELVARVESMGDFIAWRKSNGKACLSSVFSMVKGLDSFDEGEWLVSYYDGRLDEFTTFSSVAGRKPGTEKAFTRAKTLPALVLESVKVQASDAIKVAEGLRASKYKDEVPTTIVIVLQPLVEGEFSKSRKLSGKASPQPVWNITYVTSGFNVLNVKVSAESGKVLSDSISGIMDFVQKDK